MSQKPIAIQAKAMSNPIRDWKLDGGEILRFVLEKLILGLVASWTILGALASFVLVYLGLRLAFVVIHILENSVRGL